LPLWSVLLGTPITARTAARRTMVLLKVGEDGVFNLDDCRDSAGDAEIAADGAGHDA
jgi:hypothetical protein